MVSLACAGAGGEYLQPAITPWSWVHSLFLKQGGGRRCRCGASPRSFEIRNHCSEICFVEIFTIRLVFRADMRDSDLVFRVCTSNKQHFRVQGESMSPESVFYRLGADLLIHTVASPSSHSVSADCCQRNVPQRPTSIGRMQRCMRERDLYHETSKHGICGCVLL
jgi:hypothetical protein